MNKTLFISLIIVFGVFISGYQFLFRNNDENNIVYANIKALAINELNEEEAWRCCWNYISSDSHYGEMGSMIYCGDCQETPCVIFRDQNICKKPK